MLSPALETQYSPRLVDATVADMEEMKTMHFPAASSDSFMYRAAACVRK